MVNRIVQGVKVLETGNKKWEFDYDAGDMKALYNRGEWRNWQDEIRWLEQHGEKDNELTPGETVAMVEDLRSLRSERVPFTNDPNQAYQMAHNYRRQNNKQFAQEHAEIVQQARALRRR